MSRCSQGPEVVWFGNHRILSSHFAHDLVLLASSNQDHELVLRCFAAECEAAGMKNTTSNSRAMVLNQKRVVRPLQIGGEALP